MSILETIREVLSRPITPELQATIEEISLQANEEAKKLNAAMDEEVRRAGERVRAKKNLGLSPRSKLFTAIWRNYGGMGASIMACK